MFRIDTNSNTITKLAEKSFHELGFRERKHLQEWIADNPSCLGEDLLILQKEFDGFSETKERLDLLALDKQGNLVIIENKLDDSGRDAIWQVLKYASYCSSLTKDQVQHIYQQYLTKNGVKATAADQIAEFLEEEEFDDVQINQGPKQRIIMIAAKFRKEVTSTVYWLLNFSLRIQCVTVNPYALDGQLFLNFDQILPVKEAEEFVISMASKTQDEIASQEHMKYRHTIRLKFWRQCLDKANEKSDLMSDISPTKDNWLGVGIGMSGVNMNLVANKNDCRVEIYIGRASKRENKRCFDYFYSNKDKIENTFGHTLTWQRLDDKSASRIRYDKHNVSIYDENDWDEIISFLIEAALWMAETFKPYVNELSNEARHWNES